MGLNSPTLPFDSPAVVEGKEHCGPINRREAEIHPECDAMLRQIQAAADASPPDICLALQ
jgi:hypothetical protein